MLAIMMLVIEVVWCGIKMASYLLSILPEYVISAVVYCQIEKLWEVFQ